MDIQFRDPLGLYLDGRGFPAGFQISGADGDLRVDPQDEQTEEQPTSRVEYHFYGWKPRIVTVRLEISEPEDNGLERFAALALLHNAYRSDPTQQAGRHRIFSESLRSVGATDIPWVILRMPWDDQTSPDTISVTLDLLELDPERVSLVSAPPPTSSAAGAGAGSGAGATGDSGDSSITPADQQRLDDLEARVNEQLLGQGG